MTHSPETSNGTVAVCLIPVMGKPRMIEIGQDDTLKELQKLVDGYIDVLSIRDDRIDFYINDEGLSTQLPNRAIYADASMEKAGYLNQLDYSSVVKEGDLYTVLFGNIVAARCDEEGVIASLTEEDFRRLSEEFSDPTTGVLEVMRLKNRGNEDHSHSLDTRAGDARKTSRDLSCEDTSSPIRSDMER